VSCCSGECVAVAASNLSRPELGIDQTTPATCLRKPPSNEKNCWQNPSGLDHSVTPSTHVHPRLFAAAARVFLLSWSCAVSCVVVVTEEHFKMQQALARPSAAVGQFRPAAPWVRHSTRSRTAVCAEGPGGGKPIREFREDTGEISVPGEKQQQQGSQGALYADQAPEVCYCRTNTQRGMLVACIVSW
jgi:hypothetical protein